MPKQKYFKNQDNGKPTNLPLAFFTCPNNDCADFNHFDAGNLSIERTAKVKSNSGELSLTILDAATNKTLACRVHLLNAKGEPMLFDHLPSFRDHFCCDGEEVLTLPTGRYTYVIKRYDTTMVRSNCTILLTISAKRETCPGKCPKRSPNLNSNLIPGLPNPAR